MPIATIFLPRYPHIQAVLEMLDLSIRTDVNVDGRASSLHSNGFAIGHYAETLPVSSADAAPTSCGGASFASPVFGTLGELEVFCSEHITQYQAAAAELESKKEYPAKWFWSDRETETVP